MKKISSTFIIVFAVIGGFFLYISQNHTTPIFMYHSLDRNNIENCSAVEKDTFYEQMRQIKKFGYRVIGLEEYCKFLKEGNPVPKKSLILTFDDGYKDNIEAIKILEEFNYPATIFIIYNKIGNDGYLSKDDISLFLKKTKIIIGSHTINHFYLPYLKDFYVKKEIFESKQKLSNLFEQDINIISYPIGGFNKAVLEEVENSGYLCACSTNRGFSKSIDRFSLRRIKITDRDLGLRLKVKLSGFYNVFRKVRNPF
ncbi:MAG: polysaccharide deacetylase family protein [Candidatus Omnitrophica bacterium]|nr:polysaccharide deacetylase family protein [Candidatus Omnitrophota bacterium]MCK5393598.1 polysaccharide deacetylase family protein [Candidatus Omnitrophota bacterium]